VFNYLRSLPVSLKTIIVDKSFTNDKRQLSLSLKEHLFSFTGRHSTFLESFEKTIIFYDRGQRELSDILTEVFPENDRILWNSRFDKVKERLFQVADMMTFLDKLVYKSAKGFPLTKSEYLFFPPKDLRYIMKALTNKKLQ